ncbi:MAG: hypothetical protein A2Y14_02085 [Verrucomicrobia bacterium GWF2_51_19]|nr:MAG: hypothetical protein A2Y14_02085 [Verrucomicrobia bacterium GWF2_51_19]
MDPISVIYIAGRYLAYLLILLTPLAALAALIGLTKDMPLKERLHVARVTCLVSVGILLFFALTGQAFFVLLGISTPAFKIAGGIILFCSGMNMVLHRDKDLDDKPQNVDKDIAITPLAFPLIAGPATITGIFLLQSGSGFDGQAGFSGWFDYTLLCATITIAIFLIYLLFHFSIKGAEWLNETAVKLSERLTGLLLLMISVQVVASGIFASGLMPAIPTP